MKKSFFALAATLCALFGLAISAHAAWLPILSGAAICVSCFCARRLKPNDSAINVWRGVYLVAAGWLFFQEFNSENGGSPEVLLAWAVARAAAGEMALRNWMQNGFAGERRALQILLPALVLMGACNTFDTMWPKFIVPIWLGLTLLSLTSTVEFDRTHATRRASSLRVLFCALAVACGFALHVTVLLNRYEIAQVGAKLLGERVAAEASGISTRPKLGATFGAEGSLTRVLRIKNLRGGEAYFRAMSFDTYDGGAWLPTVESRTTREIFPRELRTTTKQETETARVHRLVDDEGLLFAPLHAAAISDGDAELKWARGGPLQSQDPAPDPFFYDVEMASRANFQGPLCEKPTASEMQKLLQVPDEIPLEARLLAHQVAGGLKPKDQIRAIEDHLQKTHAYSLSADPGTGDPVANFLNSDKAAHCEYFASAAVVMLRGVGLPARYVVGYYVHEKDGDATIVRLRDAHAWAECYIAGIGWVNVEATPGGARPDARGEPVPFWRKLRERLQDAALALRHFLAAMSQADRRALGIGAISLVVASVCGLWLRARKSKQTKDTFRYSARGGEMDVLARRFERWLRRAHRATSGERTLATSQTWREILRRDPRLLESSRARQWLDLYNRARFGTEEPDLAKLRKLLHEVERERTKQTKRETS